MKFLMCSPLYYGIQYEINPWMNTKIDANPIRALNQWEVLKQILLKAGAHIELINPVSGWPDMVFTANAGTYYEGKIFLSHFKFKERQGEVPYFREWFLEKGYEVIEQHEFQIPFEGAGDALFTGNKLFAGYGFRTEKNYYEKIEWMQNIDLVFCELVNPYFYHLDTCFCPLNDKQALWFPSAFSKNSQEQMQKHIELFAVEEDEAKKFACNAVVFSNKVILPTGNPKINTKLKGLGFEVLDCPMDEFMKAGGACKCLTLRVD